MTTLHLIVTLNNSLHGITKGESVILIQDKDLYIIQDDLSSKNRRIVPPQAIDRIIDIQRTAQ